MNSSFKNNKTKVTVVGLGYVGMSLGVLLAQHNDVIMFDINPERIDKVNNQNSTIADKDIEKFIKENSLTYKGVLDEKIAYQKADFVVVATPTDYDPVNNKFDTSSVDEVVKKVIELNEKCLIVIKSTIPIGHTKNLQKLHKTDRIIFSPEFLREGRALHDNLYPSRIIIGSNIKPAQIFGDMLTNAAKIENINLLFMEPSEAESVKLFSNSYLAMRVAFFNELDSFSIVNNLDTKSIIDGVCMEDRIGQGYNNPSFGYGGYCFPKDTKQLLADFDNIPQSIIESIVTSNSIRKDFLANEIVKKNPKIVGFYRLIMKEGSDNIRSSAVQGIIRRLKEANLEIVIYEPYLHSTDFNGLKVIDDIEVFKKSSDLIIANRITDEIIDSGKKIFSRDIFGEN